MQLLSMRNVMVGLCGCLAAAFPMRVAGQQPPKPDDIVVVEAQGEGMSKDEALKAALRAALEQGGKQEIFSNSKVENFQLMHDTIITRAAGIVTDYQVLSEGKGVGGTYRMKIKAKVSKSVLAKSWGELQNVLNQVGRPKVMVAINERIDGKLEEQSILETNIEERLLKSGFDLVAQKGVESIRQKEMSDAAASDNVTKLQTIAKDFGAEIFLAGTTNANQAGIENLYGAPVAFYNCDVQVKVYYTDTGKLLASKGIPQKRGGARGRNEFSPQAGKMAITNVSGELVDQLYEQIMEQWATHISAGGELVMEVEGITFGAANKLKKAISEMPGVEHVNFQLTKGTATYRINAKMGAQEFAEKVSDGPGKDLIEIGDLKLNRIQAKASGK